MYCVSIADSHEHTAEVVPATSHAGDNPPGISSAEDSLPKKSNHVLEDGALEEEVTHRHEMPSPILSGRTLA